MRRGGAGLAIAVSVLALHLLGLGLLFLAVSGSDAPGAAGGITVALGLTAYTLGARHAFDADHIAAIDNVTRRLVGEGRPSTATGFFFSLGHSTIVFALAALIVLGVPSLPAQVRDEGSALHDVTGWIGTVVSGGFLYLIAVLNLVALVGIVRSLRHREPGEPCARGAAGGVTWGPMTRLFSRFVKGVDRPWRMYPLGALFGLGFDTATEVALLFLAAGAAGSGLPFYAVLCLPILFAAGMCLLDALNGALMSRAYGWALQEPRRRAYYNLLVTAIAVAMALAIGTVQLVALLSEKTGIRGSAVDAVAAIDLSTVGYLLVAIMLSAWALALVASRRVSPVARE